MKSFNIRLLYLYLFSFVGLIITVIGLIRLVDLGMKIYVFQNADQYTYYEPTPVKDPSMPEQPSAQEQQNRMLEENRRQRQREASGAISMIIIGIPLYFYHWKTIQKENKP